MPTSRSEVSMLPIQTYVNVDARGAPCPTAAEANQAFPVAEAAGGLGVDRGVSWVVQRGALLLRNYLGHPLPITPAPLTSPCPMMRAVRARVIAMRTASEDGGQSQSARRATSGRLSVGPPLTRRGKPQAFIHTSNTCPARHGQAVCGDIYSGCWMRRHADG
jgi:hypothetical protein